MFGYTVKEGDSPSVDGLGKTHGRAVPNNVVFLKCVLELVLHYGWSKEA